MPPQGGGADDREDDRQVVTRAAGGELEAFELLYRRHAGRVYAICLRLSGDSHRARELTQDVFVRTWERLGSYRGESAFGSWLHRLAVNVVLEKARSDKRRTARVALGDDDLEERWMHAGVEPEAMDPETRIDLDRAIAKLPPGARRVFVLHDIEGYRHEEISQVTGTAPGTLRSQLHMARKLLMEALRR